MRKSVKKIMSLAVLGLFIYQGATVSALASTSDVKNSDEKVSIIQNENVANESFSEAIEYNNGKRRECGDVKCHKNFDISEHNYSSIIINGTGFDTATGTIKFEKRAEDFKLSCKNITTGKTIFSKKYLYGGPKDENGDWQGIKNLTFELKINSKYDYEVKLENYDGNRIVGEFVYKCSEV